MPAIPSSGSVSTDASSVGSSQLPSLQSSAAGLNRGSSQRRNQGAIALQKRADLANSQDFKDLENEQKNLEKLEQQKNVNNALNPVSLKNNVEAAQSIKLPQKTVGSMTGSVYTNAGMMGSGAVITPSRDEQELDDFLKRMQSGERVTETDFAILEKSVKLDKQGVARPEAEVTARQNFVDKIKNSGYQFQQDKDSVNKKIEIAKIERTNKQRQGLPTEAEDNQIKKLEENRAALEKTPEQLELEIATSKTKVDSARRRVAGAIKEIDDTAAGTAYPRDMAERLMSGPKRPAIKEKDQPENFDIGTSMNLLEKAKQEKDALEKEIETNASSIKEMETSRSSESTPEQDKALVDARNKQKELIAKRDATNVDIKEGEAAIGQVPKATLSYLQEQKNAIIPDTYFEDTQIQAAKTLIATGKDVETKLEDKKKTKAEKEKGRGESEERSKKLRAEGEAIKAKPPLTEKEIFEKGYKIKQQGTAKGVRFGTKYETADVREEVIRQEEESQYQALKENQKLIAAEETMRAGFETKNEDADIANLESRRYTPEKMAEVEKKLAEATARKEGKRGQVQSTEGYDAGIARLKDELVNGRTKKGSDGKFTKTALTEDEKVETQATIAKLETVKKGIEESNAKITQYDQGIAQADQAYLTQSPADYYKTAQTQMRGITPATELEDKKIKRAEESIATGKDIETKLEDKKKTKAKKEKERENSEEILKKLRADRDAIKAKPPLTEKEIFERGHKIKKKGKPKEVRYGSDYETYVREEVLREEKESQYQALKANQKLISDEETRQVGFETKYEDADIADLESRRYTPEKMAQEEKRLADARAQKQASAGKVQSTAGYDQQISSFEGLLKNGRMTVGAKGETVMTPLTEEEKIKTQMSLEQAKEEKTNAEAQNAQIVELQGKQDKAKQRLKFSDPQEYLRILNEEEAAKSQEKESVMTAGRESFQKLKTLKTEREKIKGQLDSGFKDNNLTPEEQKRVEEMKVTDVFDAKAREQDAIREKIENETATPEERKRLKAIEDEGFTATGTQSDQYFDSAVRLSLSRTSAEKEAIEAKPVNERTEEENSRFEELNNDERYNQMLDNYRRDQEIRAKASPDGQKIQVPLTKEERTAQEEALKLKDREIFDEEMKKKGLAEQLPQAKDEKARQEEIKSAQDRVSRLDPVKMQNAAIAKLKASKDPNLQGVGAQMESISQKELELKTTLGDTSNNLTAEEQSRSVQMDVEKGKDDRVAELQGLQEKKTAGGTLTEEENRRLTFLDETIQGGQGEQGAQPTGDFQNKKRRDEERAAIASGTASPEVMANYERDQKITNKKTAGADAKKKAEELQTQINEEKQKLGVAYDQNQGAIDQTLYKDQVSPMLTEQIATPEDQLKVAEFNDKVQERQAKEAELDPINKKITDIQAQEAQRREVAREALSGVAPGAEYDKKFALYQKFGRGEITAAEANTQSGGQLGAAFDRVSKNKMNKQAADQAKADLAKSGDSMEERVRKKEIYGKFSRGEITQAEADKQTGGGLKAAFAKVVPDKNAPKFEDLNNVGNIKEEEKRKADIEKQVAKTKEEENTLGAVIKPLVDAVTGLTNAQGAATEGAAEGQNAQGAQGVVNTTNVNTTSQISVNITGEGITPEMIEKLKPSIIGMVEQHNREVASAAGKPPPAAPPTKAPPATTG